MLCYPECFYVIIYMKFYLSKKSFYYTEIINKQIKALQKIPYEYPSYNYLFKA